MKKATHDEQLSTALGSLKAADKGRDLTHFEHEVWSEIAIREKESGDWFGSISAPALAACGVAAIALGSLFGMSKAQAYEKKTSLAIEQRYVETIHPVMMSTDHAGHNH